MWILLQLCIQFQKHSPDWSTLHAAFLKPFKHRECAEVHSGLNSAHSSLRWWCWASHDTEILTFCSSTNLHQPKAEPTPIAKPSTADKSWSDCSTAKLSFNTYPKVCYHTGIKIALLHPSQIPYAVEQGAVDTHRNKVSKCLSNRRGFRSNPYSTGTVQVTPAYFKE